MLNAYVLTIYDNHHKAIGSQSRICFRDELAFLLDEMLADDPRAVRAIAIDSGIRVGKDRTPAVAEIRQLPF